jgi:hypothetical protein
MNSNYPQPNEKPESKNFFGIVISLYERFIKYSKLVFEPIKKSLTLFNSRYPNTSQNIQLSFIFFFAIVDLLFSILTNVFALGYVPEVLTGVYPLISAMLQSPILKIWGSPEKVFFMSYFTIEFMVVRSSFKFSKLVRYNILLIFSLLMVQGLLLSYWDLLFHREIAEPVLDWTYEQGKLLTLDRHLAIFIFMNTFFIFIGLYAYLYKQAIDGKFGTIPNMTWLTDSVAFWLRLKTPTMRFGKRKRKKKDEEG